MATRGARRGAYSAGVRRRRTARMNYRTVARTRGVYGSGEMKYFDSQRSATAIPANATWADTEFPPDEGTPNTIFCPTQGTAINQRIGRKAKVFKIKIRGTIRIASQTNQTTPDSGVAIRLALVQDTQTNASQAQGEDIFTPRTTNMQTVHSFQNVDCFGRFKVLKDKTITMQNPNLSFDGTNIEQQGLLRTFKMNLTFKKPITITFNAANGGTISDIVNDSWSLYALADNTQLAPTIEYVSRVSFKE